MLPASLSELNLLVLSAIHEQPEHGYALARRLCEQCSRSALYRSLRILKSENLIQAKTVEVRGFPDRKVFSVTAAGAKLVGEQGIWNEDLAKRLERARRQFQRLNLLLRFRPLA